ncbi:MAG: PASTA domain-containing protein [bacterium]|nr:PASTA domain-containing protein [bacterium]
MSNKPNVGDDAPKLNEIPDYSSEEIPVPDELASQDGAPQDEEVVTFSDNGSAQAGNKSGSDAPSEKASSNGSKPVKSEGGKKFVWFSVKFLLLLAFSVITIVFSAVFAVTVYRSYFALPASVEVPVIQGEDIRTANAILAKSGLRLRIEEGRYSSKFPDRIVITQEPAPGKSVRKDREILAVVSLGPEQMKAPDLTGKSRREAEMLLANSKLILGKVSEVQKNSEKPNVIISQKPAPGAYVKRGAAINIEVNVGTGMSAKAVPDWSGKNVSAAAPLVEKAGLNLSRITWSIDEKAARGVIIAQNPPAGAEVASGSDVEFEVSAGLPGGRIFVQKQIEVMLPPGSDIHKVKMVLVSAAGEETVYQAEHLVGDKVTSWVSGPAGSDVEIYVNDKLFRRDKL